MLYKYLFNSNLSLRLDTLSLCLCCLSNGFAPPKLKSNAECYSYKNNSLIYLNVVLENVFTLNRYSTWTTLGGNMSGS